MKFKSSSVFAFCIVVFFILFSIIIGSAADVNVEMVGSYATANPAEGVAILDKYAYVIGSSYEDGANDYIAFLDIVDITNPFSPKLTGRFGGGLDSRAFDVAVSGKYAYVATTRGLYIVDISNPSSPTGVSKVDNTYDATDVSISGYYAYVIINSGDFDDQKGYLEIVDISNPVSPRIVGSYETDSLAESISLSGKYAYITTGNGVMIVDTSNPLAPTLAGSYDITGGATDVAIIGKYAYVFSTHYDGIMNDDVIDIYIIDITNPSSPKLVSSFVENNYGYGYPYDVAISGNYAYIANGNGLAIVDVSNPLKPTLAGSYDTAGGAKDVAVSGDNVYLAAGNSGLLILKTEIVNQITVGQGAATPEIEQLFINAYNRNGGSSLLDNPATIVHEAFGYQVQDFPGASGIPGGVIMYSPIRKNASYIHGAIWNMYYYYPNKSQLGPVAEDEKEAAKSPQGTIGRYTKFQTGTIHWISNENNENVGHPQRDKAFATYGKLDELYTNLGGTYSDLGFPIMNQTLREDGHEYCEFEGGKIEWDAVDNLYKFLEYSTGKVNIKTNLNSATFQIYGNTKTYSGSGKDWNADIPIGRYLIGFNNVDGYYTPPPIMFLLTTSGFSYVAAYSDGNTGDQYLSSGEKIRKAYGGIIIPKEQFPDGEGALIPIYVPDIIDGSNIIRENDGWKTIKEIPFIDSSFNFAKFLSGKNFEDTGSLNNDYAMYNIPTAAGINFFIGGVSSAIQSWEVKYFSIFIQQKGSEKRYRAIIQYGSPNSLQNFKNPFVVFDEFGSNIISSAIAKKFHLSGDEKYSLTYWFDEQHQTEEFKGYLSLSESDEIVQTPVVFPKDKITLFGGSLINRKEITSFSGNSYIPLMQSTINHEESGKLLELFSPIEFRSESGEIIQAHFVGEVIHGMANSESGETVQIRSPIELQICDSQGKVTGLVNGEIKEQINNSYYLSTNEKVTVFNPNDNYTYKVKGIENGTYGVNIKSINNWTNTTVFDGIDIPIISGQNHQYTIDWSSLSTSNLGVKLQVDLDGDENFDWTTFMGNTFNPSDFYIYNVTFLLPVTTMNHYDLQACSSLLLKFTARNIGTNEFIEDSTVNVTIRNSTGQIIDYFTNSTNPGSVRINSTEEQYIADLSTLDCSELKIGETYAIQVTFGDVNSLRGYAISYFIVVDHEGSGSSGGGSSGGSSSKKSSSSGGGGAGSAEDYANVAVKDVDTQYLRMNANVIYEFIREGNPIQSVSFYSLKNSGEITSTIEVLNNRSKLVNSTPEGSIYKYVNIWVGKSGFATAANIKDAKVRFKVNSSWLDDMELNPADVKLQRYNGNAWEVLPTTIESNATDYVVFESQTPGFSPFAITAEKVLASSTGDNMDVKSTETEDISMNGTQPEKTPGFGFSMTILIIGVFAGRYVYLKRRQN